MSLFGRDGERDQIVELVDAARVRSSIVTVLGSAGSGKSTLIDSVVDTVAEGDVRVLRCAPCEAEVAMAYAGLDDLLRDVHRFDGLAAPLRHALERALLRDESQNDGSALDVRMVGQAVVHLLEALAASTTVLIVIDDLHWLDAASTAVLRFAVRRLPSHGVVVLAGRRPHVDGPTIDGDSLDLPPLPDDALDAIVAERSRDSGRSMPLRRRREVVRAAQGNPMFAIELARADVGIGASAPAGRHGVPASLAALLSSRFAQLDSAALDALACIALAGPREVSLADELGIVDAVESAERDGIVDTSAGRLAFVHPLFATAAIDLVAPMARRTLHRRLAEVIVDPIERSRHQALAATGFDATIAGDLTEHAATLFARGATEHAYELAELALTLSAPSDPDRPSRCLRAADLAFRVGDSGRSTELLDAIAAPDAIDVPASVRVPELLMRARIAYETGDGRPDLLATEALALASNDHERMEALTMLARVNYDDFEAADRIAGEAIALAERIDVAPPLLAAALIARAEARVMAGHGLDRALYERAVELEQSTATFASESALGSYAVMLKVTDELDEARRMLLEILRADNDDGAVPFVLGHIVQLELWAGNWDLAEEYAVRHLDASTRTGQHDQVLQARFNEAMIELHRGDVTAAIDVGETLVRIGQESGAMWTERNGVGLQGLAALATGDATRAATVLTRWSVLNDQLRIREPGYCRLQPDLVEALVAIGDLDRAEAVVATMHEVAHRLQRPGWIAATMRVGALVTAARGDRAAAVRLAAGAVEIYAGTALVVEHARALLTLGQIHRRFKEKSAARDALQAALDVFRRLGADGFAERARQDLARIGLRAPATSSLTETERRVARVAATGRTARQVGDELFISAKTVEANLTRVYRKLGIGGRAELAAWVAAGEPDRIL